MSVFWFVFHCAAVILAMVCVVRHSFEEDKRLVFYTKNKGRTFWYNGKEMRASKLTDRLQDAYPKHRNRNSSIGPQWSDEDFYNDND